MRVEPHVGRLVQRLLPGVITTTYQARTFALHGLVWAEASQRDLDLESAQELLRRCEVVLAGISLQHDHGLRSRRRMVRMSLQRPSSMMATSMSRSCSKRGVTQTRTGVSPAPTWALKYGLGSQVQASRQAPVNVFRLSHSARRSARFWTSPRGTRSTARSLPHTRSSVSAAPATLLMALGCDRSS